MSEEQEKPKRYLSVKSYAKQCGVGVHAIYMRITKSDAGMYKEGDDSYLEVTELEEVDGVFIDSKEFPPKKMKKGRKKLKVKS